MKAFNIEADNAMSIADKFNAVSNNFAISASGIGEAMQKSSSALSTAGNTIDQSIALITAANTTVQDESRVGNAMKTISIRIRGAKTELEEAGESVEGMAESTSKLREQIMALSGVDIMIDDNTFKSTYEVIDELSKKWESLTDIQRASLTDLMAGKNQANVFNSLMSNFNIAREALDTSVNSSGSAMEENAKYLDSIAGRMDQLKASFESLSNTVISSDLVKTVVSAGTTILDILNGILDVTGSIVPLLSGGAIYAFIKNLD